MSDLQTEQHRKAWAAVVEVLPGVEFVSHEVELDDSDPDIPVIEMSIGAFMGVVEHCPTCGDPKDVVGLTFKCRDWHEVCNCGNRYDEPKAKGCRRRKHPKPEKEKK